MVGYLAGVETLNCIARIDEIISRQRQSLQGQPSLVDVCGPPGSGKTYVTSCAYRVFALSDPTGYWPLEGLPSNPRSALTVPVNSELSQLWLRVTDSNEPIVELVRQLNAHANARERGEAPSVEFSEVVEKAVDLGASVEPFFGGQVPSVNSISGAIEIYALIQAVRAVGSLLARISDRGDEDFLGKEEMCRSVDPESITDIHGGVSRLSDSLRYLSERVAIVIVIDSHVRNATVDELTQNLMSSSGRIVIIREVETSGDGSRGEAEGVDAVSRLSSVELKQLPPGVMSEFAFKVNRTSQNPLSPEELLGAIRGSSGWAGRLVGELAKQGAYGSTREDIPSDSAGAGPKGANSVSDFAIPERFLADRAPVVEDGERLFADANIILARMGRSQRAVNGIERRLVNVDPGSPDFAELLELRGEILKNVSLGIGDLDARHQALSSAAQDWQRVMEFYAEDSLDPSCSTSSDGRVKYKLAEVLFLLGGDSLGRALSLLDESISDAVKLYGEGGFETLMRRWAKVNLCRDSGLLSEAMSAAEENLSCCRATRGPEDSLTLAFLGELGIAKGVSGDVRGAIDLLTELVSTRTRIEGSFAYGTLIAQANLAFWTNEAGNPDKALRMYEDVLAKRLLVLDPHDVRIAQTHANLGRIAASVGQGAVAVEQMGRAADSFERAEGGDGKLAFGARLQRAVYLSEVDPADGAKELLRLLANPRAISERSEWDYYSLQFLAGRKLRDAGEAAAAKKLFKDAKMRLRAAGREDSSLFRVACYEFAHSLAANGQRGQALKEMKALKDVHIMRFGPQDGELEVLQKSLRSFKEARR